MSRTQKTVVLCILLLAAAVRSRGYSTTLSLPCSTGPSVSTAMMELEEVRRILRVHVGLKPGTAPLEAR
jgi:hypothetical protein